MTLVYRLFLGGQHTPFWGGQLKPFSGGQFERFLQADVFR
jgi:hypothetical protein